MNNRNNTLIQIYKGSSKNIFKSTSQSQTLLFEFTDYYSVFDYGIMPDPIANKGLAQTILTNYLFNSLNRSDFYQELKNQSIFNSLDQKFKDKLFTSSLFNYLCQKPSTIPISHSLGLNQGNALINETKVNVHNQNNLYLEVYEAEKFTTTPQKFYNHTVYFYQTPNPHKYTLLPLEIVFRFKLDPQSSFLKRCQNDQNYAQQFGLNDPSFLNPLPYPIIEFFSKLEPKDRLLTYSEAALMTKLNHEEFRLLIEFCTIMAMSLYYIFHKRNINLIDGKFEIIKVNQKENPSNDYQPSFILADSIGPDELRLEYNNNALSKEVLRKFYRKTQWYKSLQDPTINLKPPNLPLELKQIIDNLYGTLVNHILNQNIFPDQLNINQLVDKLKEFQ